MIQAVIFDCFGVLASEAWGQFRETYFGHDDALVLEANDVMKALNLGMLTPDEFLITMSKMSKRPVEELQALFYHNVPDEALFRYIKDNKKRFKYGVLSNIQQGRIEHIFSKEQLDLFDVLTLSGDIGLAKPDPNAYYYAANQLDVLPEECLFVDDQPRNVEVAKETGMLGIVYESFRRFEVEARKLLD